MPGVWYPGWFCGTPGWHTPLVSVSAPPPCSLRLLTLLAPSFEGSLEGCVILFPDVLPPAATLLGSLASRRPLPYLPLESTLAKVYQNKQLYLPLESPLMKNPGEGVPTRTSVPTQRMRKSARVARRSRQAR